MANGKSFMAVLVENCAGFRSQSVPSTVTEQSHHYQSCYTELFLKRGAFLRGDQQHAATDSPLDYQCCVLRMRKAEWEHFVSRCEVQLLMALEKRWSWASQNWSDQPQPQWLPQ
jgi:hypothetical protein